MLQYSYNFVLLTALTGLVALLLYIYFTPFTIYTVLAYSLVYVMVLPMFILLRLDFVGFFLLMVYSGGVLILFIFVLALDKQGVIDISSPLMSSSKKTFNFEFFGNTNDDATAFYKKNPRCWLSYRLPFLFVSVVLSCVYFEIISAFPNVFSSVELYNFFEFSKTHVYYNATYLVTSLKFDRVTPGTFLICTYPHLFIKKASFFKLTAHGIYVTYFFAFAAITFIMFVGLFGVVLLTYQYSHQTSPFFKFTTPKYFDFSSWIISSAMFFKKRWFFSSVEDEVSKASQWSSSPHDRLVEWVSRFNDLLYSGAEGYKPLGTLPTEKNVVLFVYFFLAACVLFVIPLVSLLFTNYNKNILKFLISIELMFLSNFLLIATYSYFFNLLDGAIFIIFTMGVLAVETALILALYLKLQRNKKTNKSEKDENPSDNDFIT